MATSRVKELEGQIRELQQELHVLILNKEKELAESMQASLCNVEENIHNAQNQSTENTDNTVEVKKNQSAENTDTTVKDEKIQSTNSPDRKEGTLIGKRSEIKPSSFKGSELEDWVIWLRNYEQISSLNNWSENFKLARIPTVLEGDANLKYWECTEEERQNWNNLTKALSAKFAPESNRATFQAALESRHRRKDESLDAYMSAIKSLARKAFPEWDDKYRDIMVRKYFTDGLEETLKIWVLQANPKTAEEALQVALRTEANLNKKQGVTANMANSQQSINTTDLAEAITIALEKRGIGSRRSNTSMGRGGRGQRNWQNRGGGQGNRQGTCHACGQHGHFWRDMECPKSPHNQGNGRGTGAQGQANSRPW